MLIRRFGPATVYALTDGDGPFFQPRGDAFPTATPQHWADADRLDPAAERDGGWWLPFRCFLVRLDSGPDSGRVILVDTGIGGADALSRTWAPVPGNLPAELAAAGVAPSDVDTVVITHLHTDHIGWAVDAGTPYFGAARYLVPRADVEALDRFHPDLDGAVLAPLRESGQLVPVEGDLDVAAGVRVVATPGHTPGHQSVLLDGSVLFTGDLLVHTVQLVDPELAYAHDSVEDQARDSRVAWLARHRGVLAT